MNQMPDNIERAHSAFAFVAVRPRFGQIAQKRIKSSRRASEKRYCAVQIVFAHCPLTTPKRAAQLLKRFGTHCDYLYPWHLIICTPV